MHIDLQRRSTRNFAGGAAGRREATVSCAPPQIAVACRGGACRSHCSLYRPWNDARSPAKQAAPLTATALPVVPVPALPLEAGASSCCAACAACHAVQQADERPSAQASPAAMGAFPAGASSPRVEDTPPCDALRLASCHWRRSWPAALPEADPGERLLVVQNSVFRELASKTRFVQNSVCACAWLTCSDHPS